ncbi:helix-turn-helix transcriptional regulator [Mycobacterium szulgai]|nr:helix-turn-helix transcriptional regulator [Mycobacterium szulgai]
MTDDFLVDFGAIVRRLRERRGMTQAELAERVNLGRTSMTNLERGNQNPPLSILPLLAQALGVSISGMFGEIDFSRGDAGQAVLDRHVRDDALRSWASRVIYQEPDSSESPELSVDRAIQ